MDYNNIINNKKKLKDIKNVTLGILNKATDKITEITSTAVDSVTDTVKSMSKQQAKVSIFADVVSYVDKKLINGTMEDENYRLTIMEYKIEGIEGISVEDILKDVTSAYDEELREVLTDFDYIEGVYAMILAHYKHENGVDFVRTGGHFTLNITKNASNEEVQKEEHTCDCNEKCEVCECQQNGITMVPKNEEEV